MTELPRDLGIIIVDHGSQRAEANAMLLDVVEVFKDFSGATIVEAAHMELAEPTLEQAFQRCVAAGASEVVVHPYFLAPGRHSTSDIPALVAKAAEAFPDVRARVTEPLGLDGALGDLILRRIQAVLD